MTDAERNHIAEIERIKVAMKKTKSNYLYNDYRKYLKKLIRELNEYRHYRNA